MTISVPHFPSWSTGEYTADHQNNDSNDKKRCAPEGISPEEKKKNFADKRAAHYNEVSENKLS